MASCLHNLPNNILLLLEILVDVRLTKFILVLRAVLVCLEGFLGRVSRHDTRVRGSPRRILQRITGR